MRALAVATALLLSACTTTGGGAPPSREWLVGTWLLIGPDLEYPLACASGLPITYEADGTYHMFEEQGVWRLEGNRLYEGATQADDPVEARVGVTNVNRVARRGPDEMEKRFEDGGRATLRRCPSPH